MGKWGSDSLNVLPSVVHVPSMARRQAAVQDSKGSFVIANAIARLPCWQLCLR